MGSFFSVKAFKQVVNFWVECRKSQVEWGPGHVFKRPIVGSRVAMVLYRISSEMWVVACHCKYSYFGWNVGGRRGNGELGMSLNGPLFGNWLADGVYRIIR